MYNLIGYPFENNLKYWIKNIVRCAWVAYLVKYLTLDFVYVDVINPIFKVFFFNIGILTYNVKWKWQDVRMCINFNPTLVLYIYVWGGRKAWKEIYKNVNRVILNVLLPFFPVFKIIYKARHYFYNKKRNNKYYFKLNLII